MTIATQKDFYKAEYNFCKSEGEYRYHLIRFGDHIAEREAYKKHKGLDAVHFYLVEKYRWLPSQVKSLNDADLKFLLAEEMQSWTLPKDAIVQDR